MLRLRLLVIALGIVLGLSLGASSADACMNATMSDNEAVVALKAAEEALAVGDVATASHRANDVRMQVRWNPSSRHLIDRATRIAALSLVRNPNATARDLEEAVESLKRARAERAELALPSDPALDADFGEALEAAGRNDEAHAILAPLASRDLIGSAYAYGALSRVAKGRGDAALAMTSQARCLAMTATPAACSGAYPRPARLWVWLDGTPSGYLTGGFTFLAALGLGRFLVARRRKGRLAAPFLAALELRSRLTGIVSAIFVLGFGALAFLTALSEKTVIVFGALAGLVAIASLLDLTPFVNAIRRGDPRTAAFVVRAAGPEDASLPVVEMLSGPNPPQTIERLEDASYREGARTPLFRIAQRPAKKLVAVTALGVFGVFAVAVIAALLTFSRSAKVAQASTGLPEAPPLQAVPEAADAGSSGR